MLGPAGSGRKRNRLRDEASRLPQPSLTRKRLGPFAEFSTKYVFPGLG